jgi:3-oxo-5-alpha-steroid 4-dehydrogenase 1
MMLLLAPVIFLTLFFVSAPYGRFARQGWGPVINNRIGWMVMEAPASLLVIYFMTTRMDLNTVTLVFLLLWQSHYFYRAFVYPFTLKGVKKMPLLVPVMAILFNSVNAYLMSYHFVLNPNQYDIGWLTTPFFIGGTMLFGLGYYITRQSDAMLRRLRKPDEVGYKVPNGFLYRFVSCPNYLGEIIQWAGWAILTWSPAGLVFLIWTLANLVPRAVSHHQWYKETFSDYPPDRKALLPFVL